MPIECGKARRRLSAVRHRSRRQYFLKKSEHQDTQNATRDADGIALGRFCRVRFGVKLGSHRDETVATPSRLSILYVRVFSPPEESILLVVGGLVPHGLKCSELSQCALHGIVSCDLIRPGLDLRIFAWVDGQQFKIA